MKEFKTIDDILNFAINSEQEAIDFYLLLAQRATSDDMTAIFESFVEEEMKHKERLLEVKETGSYRIEQSAVADLHIADYVTKVKPSPDMDYQDSLILAMQKEKAAFKLYTNLANRAPSNDLRVLFESLAMEESKHKLRFEMAYDEYILREN
ncbi:MAG: ferritin family protein [Salinivirgaceae bacterium]|jgi:rubrerythrin|nr:ferritin family protein [Salinivirgaceae bacterium]